MSIAVTDFIGDAQQGPALTQVIVNNFRRSVYLTPVEPRTFTEKITKDGTTLWRARFAGFDSDEAQAACRALKRDGFNCFASRG